MRKPIAVESIVLIAVLSLSIALADRMKERVSQDRFSVGFNATELTLKQ